MIVKNFYIYKTYIFLILHLFKINLIIMKLFPLLGIIIGMEIVYILLINALLMMSQLHN